MASTDLLFVDEAQATGALADVRDNNSPTNWCLFTYSESAKNTLDFVGKGSGGLDELKSRLDESKIFYGLLRVTDKIDNSLTVKFVFIVWCGEKVPFVQKGKMTTHKGSITTLIGQSHVALNCSNLSEITEEIIMARVSDASGTSYRVKEKDSSLSPSSSASASPSSRAQTSPSSQAQTSSPASGYVHRTVTKESVSKRPGVPQGGTSIIQFVNEEEIRQAIKQVRSDNDDHDWVLLGYEGNTGTKIYLQGTGSDGLDGVLSRLKADEVQYALLRTTDTVDNTVAVKFVLVLWVGENVPVTRKARITTHKGELTSFVGQYHVDCACSNPDEINEEIIRDLVQRASGTASFVKK